MRASEPAGEIPNAARDLLQCEDFREIYGGEGEIRTPGALSGSSAFEAGAFNHSATSPRQHNMLMLQPFQFSKGL